MKFTFRPRAFITALKSAWPAGLALGGILFAAIGGWAMSDTRSEGILYAGVILQLLGLGTVAIGLWKLRNSFRQPSDISWSRKLAAVFIRPEPHVIELTGTLTGTATVEAASLNTERADAPLDRRVALLEENLERLRREVDEGKIAIRNEMRTITEAVTQERQTREIKSRQILDLIKEVEVGGLHLESVGLLWLVIGIFGTSIPDQLAKKLSFFLPG